MSQPKVTITELDGALGVVPATAGRLLAVLGVSSAGPYDTPATYAKVSALVADYGAGPGVEAAAHWIERYGRPVIFVRTGQSTAGTCSAVTFAGSGTSVATVAAVPAPTDDLEIVIEVVTGGTRGVAGITYKLSLDGGRTFGATLALGTGISIPVTGAGTVTVDLAAGTLVAGDTISFRTTAPKWNGTEIGTALDALFASTLPWGIAEVAGPIDGTAFDTIDPKFSGGLAAGKPRAWIGHFRNPNAGESASSYRTAFETAFSSRGSVFGAICAGSCWLVSSVSGRRYTRPSSFAIAAREASLSEEQNSADVNLGPLPGLSIRDDNGNPLHHDESFAPGLDAARATVLRTWEGVQGVYVNRPRLLAPAGSDFDRMANRRVMNLAHEALNAYFLRRLNRPIRVDKRTGYILPAEAAEIEAGARATMRDVLLARPKASAVEFSLSRTDNLLSTRELNGEARVVPLGYAETISVELGFRNPAIAAS